MWVKRCAMAGGVQDMVTSAPGSILLHLVCGSLVQPMDAILRADAGLHHTERLSVTERRASVLNPEHWTYLTCQSLAFYLEFRAHPIKFLCL